MNKVCDSVNTLVANSTINKIYDSLRIPLEDSLYSLIRTIYTDRLITDSNFNMITNLIYRPIKVSVSNSVRRKYEPIWTFSKRGS